MKTKNIQEIINRLTDWIDGGDLNKDPPHPAAITGLLPRPAPAVNHLRLVVGRLPALPRLHHPDHHVVMC